MMLSNTYEAFISAGVPTDKAKKANEKIAGFDRQLVRLEVMNALILAGVVSLVIKTFFT